MLESQSMTRRRRRINKAGNKAFIEPTKCQSLIKRRTFRTQKLTDELSTLSWHLSIERKRKYKGGKAESLATRFLFLGILWLVQINRKKFIELSRLILSSVFILFSAGYLGSFLSNSELISPWSFECKKNNWISKNFSRVQTALKTNQIEVNTDIRTLRPIARLKEPRDLFALPKERENECAQQLPRWPNECQVRKLYIISSLLFTTVMFVREWCHNQWMKILLNVMRIWEENM